MSKIEVKTQYQKPRGLGLYLPKNMAQEWDRRHRKNEDRIVQTRWPLTWIQSLFEILGVFMAEDVGTLLGRYVGMTNEIATEINHDLTLVYTELTKGGMKHNFKINQEPASWQLSRERGWDKVKR